MRVTEFALSCLVVEKTVIGGAHVCALAARDFAFVTCTELTKQLKPSAFAQTFDALIIDGSTAPAYELLQSLPLSAPPYLLIGNGAVTAEEAWRFGSVDFLVDTTDSARMELAFSRLQSRARERALVRSLTGAVKQSADLDAPSELSPLRHLGDIVAIEADGNYVVLHHRNGDSIRRRGTLQQSVLLSESSMVRVHRRWAVNRADLPGVARGPRGMHVTIAGATVPIGRSFVNAVLEACGQLPSINRAARAGRQTLTVQRWL